MQKLVIVLIILLIVIYYFSINNKNQSENFTNINSKKYEDALQYEEPKPDYYQQVGYHNLFDWNKSKAIPISPQANQITYDINSTEPTGFAYNNRFPWIAPNENPDNFPNSQMNQMDN